MRLTKRALAAILLAFSTPALAENNQINCLATAIHFEARGETLAGQKAVADVIINRTGDKKFPNTICGVIKQKRQFSFWPSRLITSGPLWELAKDLYKDPPKATNGALYFHSRKINPKWKKKRVLSLGNHIFYK